ncbi:hypothetical protein ACH42_11405 [Endozoicomonas sp. (ex Bugula neritina AB1)]|nr:hypothetical protein ACH42_11405 [Endozoicomonas sp. (ex Bugula neritina AB1)]
MATNGESARQWLKDNKQKASESRIKQIRDNLNKKAHDLSNADDDDIDDQYQGVLEALEIMDTFIEKHFAPVPDTKETSAILDSSSLISDTSSDVPLLSSQEKQARFQALLKTSKF